MVTQSLRLKSFSSFFWERKWEGSLSYRAFFLNSFPSLLGKRRGGDHGHTEPSSEKLSSHLLGKGRGGPILIIIIVSIIVLLLFWEREGLVVMVIQSLLLKSSPLSSGKGVVVMAIQSLLLKRSPLPSGKGKWW